RAPDPTCALFEPQRCDVFITEATFAMPIYRWPTMAEVIAELDAFWAECQAQGETAVLLCYALGKAQRVLAELHARCPHRRDEVVLLHGAMETPVEIYRRAGIDMLKGESLIGSGVESTVGRLLIAPPSAAGSPYMSRVKNPKVAFASGWMQVRGVRRRASHDRGFVISDHADWPALIDSIKGSGATRVLATHGRTQALVRYLNEQGIRASALATELGGEDT
ncbi:MAG TPA: DNA ligase-associated DEXH box helicase, partial [Xanthomonadales bacterium]|nr:DNA ligase-associated DEXH box helicase [Xanthomonadales bacterium]